MNNVKHAGRTGKGFYAALSLSVAMVGAGCWYAFTAAGRKPLGNTVQPPELSIAESLPAHSATRPTGTTAATTPQTTRTTARTTEDAEEAAALLRHTTAVTEEAVTTTLPAVTTAPAETPLMPVIGEIAAPYSAGELVKSKTTGIWVTHNGVDIAAPIGTEVCAVLDGTVTEIRRDALYGVCVTLLHEDGTVTRCCGLNENLDVIAGQVLERGTVLGTVGDTNEAERAEGAHLHFEVLRNDSYVDPAAFLGLTAPAAE